MSARGEKVAKMHQQREAKQSSMRQRKSEGIQNTNTPSDSTTRRDEAKLSLSRDSSLSELTPSVVSSSVELDSQGQGGDIVIEGEEQA